MKRALSLVTAVLALAFSLQAADSQAPAAKKTADAKPKVTATAKTSCSADCCGQSACSAGMPSKKAFLSPRAAENAKK